MAEVQRYISSSFWSDDWVDSLSISGKLLYMYLLTNESTTIAGVYKITLKRMKDDTGIPRDEIQSLLKHFEESKKAFYFQEYIILPKWPKHQKIRERTTIYLGMVSCLKALPDEIQAFLMKDQSHYWLNLDEILHGKTGIPHSQKTIPYGKSDMGYSQNAEIPDTPSDDSDSDYDSDLDSEFKDNGDGYTESDGEKSTTTIFTLQEEIKKTTGITIDEKIASRIVALNLSPEGTAGPHNFFVFAKETVDSGYADRTETERRKLFISAVTTWENLREEYPEWRKKREKKAAVDSRKASKSNMPTRCDACGGELNSLLSCKNCGGFFQFDGGKYVFFSHDDSGGIDLKKITKLEKVLGKETPEQVPEESFIPDTF